MTHTKNISWILAVLAMGAILGNCGCNGGYSAPPPPALAVNVVPGGAQTIDQGQTKNFTANVSNDSSNKGVSWTLTQNGTSCSPGCGTISPANTASGAPATYTAPAAVSSNIQFNVTAISVADSTKSASDSTTAVPPPALNNPASLPAATIGRPYSFQLTEAGGVAPFTWSIKSGSLPPGLSLNSSTGLISGTLSSAVNAGTLSREALDTKSSSATAASVTANFQFTVGVVDSGTPQLQAAQAMAIPAALSSLAITTSSLPNAVAGAAYSQTLAATGGLAPYTWSVVSGSLPTGLTLSSTGTISGTPTAPGTFNFQVQATDTAPSNQTAQQTLSIIVTTVAITSPNFFGGTIGTAFSATLTGSGGTTPYTWSAGPTLPAGLTLNKSTGAIAGTPTGPVATDNLTVQVQDSGNPKQTATQFLDITIGTKMSITTMSLPNGTVGTPYSASVLVSGGISPIAWAITGGSLPAGLTLSASSGMVTGTPTGPAGTSNFTVQVTDTSSPALVLTQGLSIKINPANTPQFAFGRTSFPDGKIGTAYDQLVTTVNGKAPATITLVSGALPAGLGLSTVNSATSIAGTPTGPNGTATFTLQAIDSSTPAQTITMQYTISITAIGACVFDVSGAGPPNGNSALKGIYVYRFQGFDANGNAIARLGIFTADGNQSRTTDQAFGHITGDTEESMSIANGYSAPASLDPVPPAPPDRYCVNPTTNITQITLGNVQYQAAIIGNSLGASDGISFIEFDATDKVRGSGLMRLQQAAVVTQPASGTVSYVFGMSGRNNGNASNANAPVAVVGTFSLNAGLASASGLSGSTGEEDFDDPAANGLVVPTVNYPGIMVSLTSNNPVSATGRYTGTLISSPAAGDINFSAYVITAAGAALPSTNSPTMLFAISTGMPAKTVLSGEIVSQNFASETTFTNSKPAGTPDARALAAPSSMFYISGRDPAVTSTSTAEASAAAVGFLAFDGGRLNLGPGPSGNIASFELDTDVGGTVQGPITATNPPGATYTVAPDGRTTFNGGSIPALAYLSDFDTGFVLDSAGTFATAGFGQLLLSRNPGAGFPPVLGNFALVGDVATPVFDSKTTVGSVSPIIGGLTFTMDEDDPFAGLVVNPQPYLLLPFTKTDAFGRFTLGTCPLTGGASGVCLVGYDSGAFGQSGGMLVLDETNTGANLKPQWPSITIWGIVP